MVVRFPPRPTPTASAPTSNARLSQTSSLDWRCQADQRRANKIRQLDRLDSEAAERIEDAVDKMIEFHALHARWAAERAE